MFVENSNEIVSCSLPSHAYPMHILSRWYRSGNGITRVLQGYCMNPWVQGVECKV